MATFGATPVDEIKQRLDIAEMLSEYVKPTPSGANQLVRFL